MHMKVAVVYATVNWLKQNDGTAIAGQSLYTPLVEYNIEIDNHAGFTDAATHGLTITRGLPTSGGVTHYVDHLRIVDSDDATSGKVHGPFTFR